MKRVKFYTRCHNCTIGQDVIKEAQGYSDGTFFYWRSHNVWHAVHPATGISPCYGYTLRETATKANSTENICSVLEFLEKHGARSIEKFETMLKNVGITGYNWQEIAGKKRISK